MSNPPHSDSSLMQDTSTDVGPMLRRRADAVAAATANDPVEPLVDLSLEDTRAMLHELHVHQIELGMQNEELRRSQVQLDISRALYFDLYDLAPMGYCTLGQQGKIVQANLTAGTLLGLTRSQLIGKPISRFILKENQDVYFQFRKVLLARGELHSCELQMVRDDGVAFWAHLIASEVEDADGVTVHRLVLSDISDRKLMEQALLAKNTELEEAKQVADKANRAKSEFLSSMSHELRTPLNAILGFAQLIEAGDPPPTSGQKTRVDQILKAGWYLLELVNEILDLAVIESGSVSMTLEPLRLSEVLDDCQAMIEPLAQASDITVTYCLPDNPCWVQADRMHLKQVLVNLISNAIKYNQFNGSVEVTCSTGEYGRMRISIRDSGQGLSTEKLGQLFQPFNRLGQETGNVKGTGIGLVVSKRLVELMDGEIGVSSTVGEGSVFWIEFKLAQCTPAFANATTSDLRERADSAPLRNDIIQHTLLYVEDNLQNLQLVEALIARRPQLRLLTARDGPSGIALAHRYQPAIILMDISLPGMSGLQALNRLRQDPATKHIPVLALSANAMASDIEKGMAAGFFHYITKPIKIDSFMEVLDQALAFSEANAPTL